LPEIPAASGHSGRAFFTLLAQDLCRSATGSLHEPRTQKNLSSAGENGDISHT